MRDCLKVATYARMYVCKKKEKEKESERERGRTLNCDVSVNVMYRSYTGEVFGPSEALKFERFA